MSNIAISELQTEATTLNDEDLILVSKKDGTSFTSAKMKGSNLKSEIISISTILSTIYPQGSVYIDASDSSTCPLQSLISGSTWEKLGTSIITGVSGTVSVSGSGTIPVKGDGNTLGILTGGDYKCGLCGGDTNNRFALYENTYGKPIGTTVSGTNKVPNTSLGVTTDSDKSGLVADVSSFTASGSVSSASISVNIWKRIN